MKIELISTSIEYGTKVFDFILSKTGYFVHWTNNRMSSNPSYKVYVYKVIPGKTYSVTFGINGLSVAGISYWDNSLPDPIPSGYSTGFVSVDANSRGGNGAVHQLTNYQITPTTEYVYFSNLKNDPAPVITYIG